MSPEEQKLVEKLHSLQIAAASTECMLKLSRISGYPESIEFSLGLLRIAITEHIRQIEQLLASDEAQMIVCSAAHE